MRAGLSVGHRFEFSIQVTEAMRPQFGEQIIHPLYATASMLNHMEWAARQHVLPYLEPDEESVGYHIDLKHLAATPVGATVRIASTVTQVKARKVVSRVEAWHGHRKIGDGFLTQALVRKDQLYTAAPSATGTQTSTAIGHQSAQTPESSAKIPPAAALMDDDEPVGLRLEIIKWETGQFPCSRYDEWLVCQAVTYHKDASNVYKGAFLLRHEIEEWLNACQKMATGEMSQYRSDFLEPVFSVEMTLQPDQRCQCALSLSEPGSTPYKRQNSERITLNLTQKNLSRFCKGLIDQLDGFPSRL
jgi:predicted thioesterase